MGIIEQGVLQRQRPQCSYLLWAPQRAAGVWCPIPRDPGPVGCCSSLSDCVCVMEPTKPQPLSLSPTNTLLCSPSQHQHRHSPPTYPLSSSWLCGILATTNRVPMESPCSAACRLVGSSPSNIDGGNDFTLYPPPARILNMVAWSLGHIIANPSQKSYWISTKLKSVNV